MIPKLILTNTHEKMGMLNWRFLLLFWFSILNLLFMHYNALITIPFENRPGGGFASNLLACITDTVVIYIVCWLVTMGRTKAALVLTFSITTLLSFCNGVYSRFFETYLPKKALSNLGNLNDGYVISSVIDQLCLTDLYYVLATFVFVILLCKWHKRDLTNYSWSAIGTIVVGVLCIQPLMVLLLLTSGKEGSWDGAYASMASRKIDCMTKPNIYMFKSGFVKRFIDFRDEYTNKKIALTDSQVKKIETERNDMSHRATVRHPLKGKNVIFILVESYSAVSSELKVDGKEITPFLNSLKRDSNCFFNGHLMPNTRYGESSDGQLIYMTGLLPMQSGITVEYAKNCQLFALPKMLKERGYINNSHIVVPTSATFWMQDEMCKVYGIDKIYSKTDIDPTLGANENVMDGQILDFAASVAEQTTKPFFSLILTINMHAPYTTFVEHDFRLNNKKLPDRFRNYLMTCHYFDKQVERYFERLKKNGLYENSLIVIASDHDAHPHALNMEGIVPIELPLYIINGSIDEKEAWLGECNQLDVYTTLADLFGLDSWRGLGHSLLQHTYSNSVTEDIKEMSEWIIRSDYFRTHP